MANASYDILLPYILTETPGVSHPLAISAINRAFRHLCLESSCWYGWHPLVLVAGQADYECTPPDSAVVRNIKSVVLDGRELNPIPENVVLSETPWLATDTGTPTGYFVERGVVKLMPSPSQTDHGASLRIKAAYVPAPNATEADAGLLDRHAETITAGAKSYLLLMSGQPWANPSLVPIYSAEFERGVSRARIEVAQSESMSGLRIAKRRFGA